MKIKSRKVLLYQLAAIQQSDKIVLFKKFAKQGSKMYLALGAKTAVKVNLIKKCFFTIFFYNIFLQIFGGPKVERVHQ